MDLEVQIVVKYLSPIEKSIYIHVSKEVRPPIKGVLGEEQVEYILLHSYNSH
jgi:hypothetical protein